MHATEHDHGTCGSCGAPRGPDMYCAGCGHVDGIFGQALAHHAERLRRADSD